MKNIIIYTIFCLTISGTFLSCTQDNDDHEQELITTFVFTMTPENGGNPVICVFSDPDGDGGIAPLISTTGSFEKGTNYKGSIIIRNESSIPPTDITTEIKEEASEHQFFFIVSGGASGKILFTYADIDENGKPVGLETDVRVTGESSTGKLKVVLRHEPNKTGVGVSNGDITNAGGETDIEIEFDVSIQ